MTAWGVGLAEGVGAGGAGCGGAVVASGAIGFEEGGAVGGLGLESGGQGQEEWDCGAHDHLDFIMLWLSRGVFAFRKKRTQL